MKGLIEALSIFLKYQDEQFPTHCEHKVLMIAGIEENELTEEDKARVQELHFSWSKEYDSWTSSWYGSA